MRRALSVVLAVVVAAALVVAALYATAPPASRVKVGDRAPELTLPPFTGGAPQRLPGQAAVVLALLDMRFPDATFRLADLERLHRRYGPRGLRVVGVSLDADTGPVRAAAETVGLTFVLLRDPGGAALQATYGVPSGFVAYVIAPTGVVLSVHRDRFDWRSSEVRAELEAHLAPPPPGW